MRVIEQNPLLLATQEICDQEIRAFLEQQRLQEQDYDPRLDLCKLLDIDLELSEASNGQFLRGIVRAAQEKLANRLTVNRHGVSMSVLRRMHNYGDGLRAADNTRLFLGNDGEVSISTTFGARNIANQTHISSVGDVVAVRRELLYGRDHTVELLGDIASQVSYSYDEYVDAVAIDLYGSFDGYTISDDREKQLWIPADPVV